jgi:subtilisin family serine protease
MTSKHARGLGLVTATALWITLTGWVLVAAGVDPQGVANASEPPPSHAVWGRLTSQAQALFGGRPADAAREAVRQALEQLGAGEWHRAGRRGKGVKVAVLDSGFKGYRAALGEALPASVLARSFRKDGQLEARESQHGILCAEVVHHVAPEAELLFANWEPEQPGSFLEAVRWARRQGAQVISCSIIMPSWSDGEGGGGLHRALVAILGPGGRPSDGLFFASAGNTALRHWGGALAPGPDGWHAWQKGKKDNPLRPLGRERVSVELTAGPLGFELVVADVTRPREVGRSRSLAGDGCASAVVRFEPQAGHRYAVRVRAPQGQENAGPAGRFHLTVLGGRLQYTTAAGSIPFPGDGAEVVAVGAADARGRRLGYSSCGPCGAAAKPDLAAAVPFPSVWRPEQPFAGTSAAAPQAAALAALLWSAHPEWTASQVREALAKAAVKARPGHSSETGQGLLRLPR